jgi:hypothetical protein
VRAILSGVVVLVLVSMVQSSPASAGTDAPQQPTVEVVENADSETLTYGIAGSGWRPATLVQLELCGNDARNGSVDCALGTAQIVAADAQGQVRGRLSTSPPPSLCPCVVRAVSLGSDETATTPVRVPGVAEMPPGAAGVEPPPAVTELTVGSRLVADGSPWGPWVGTAPKRTLVVMVANTGNVPVDDAVLSITVGRSKPPTGFTEPVALGAIDVGEVREVEVPVELPTLTWGGYQVHGEISGTDEPVEFAESTSSYPWLLIVLGIFGIAHLALVLLRREIRKRLPDDDSSAMGGPEPRPSLPAASMLAIGPSDRTLPPGDAAAPAERTLGADLVYVVEVSPGNGSALVLDSEVRDRLVHEYYDERRHRVHYTVLGLRTAKQLISAVVRSADERGFPRWHERRIVEMVSIPPIVTASQEEIEEAGMELGRWLGADHGFTVYMASGRDGANLRTAVRVDDRPDFGAARHCSTSSWLRLECGVPAVMYRMLCPTGAAALLDELVADLRADGVLAFADHSDDDSEISVRANHLDAVVAVRDRVAASVSIRRGHLSGLIPVRMVNGVDYRALDRLGIEAKDTFEYQLISTAETRSLEAARRELWAGDTDSEASDSRLARELRAPSTTLALAHSDMAVHPVRY